MRMPYYTSIALNNIIIKFEIHEKDNGTTIGLKPIKSPMAISFSGAMDGSRGQIVDDLTTANTGLSQEEVDKLKGFWKRWHLNDMNAGTRKQRELLKEWKGRPEGWCFDAECEYLRKNQAYEDNGYEYGSGWLVEEIPAKALQEIKDWFELHKIMEAL